MEITWKVEVFCCEEEKIKGVCDVPNAPCSTMEHDNNRVIPINYKWYK